MRWLGLALIGCCAVPVSAAQTRLLLDYELRFGPVRLVEMRATVDLDGTQYGATTELRTVGIAGVLFPWTARSWSVGTQSPSGLAPGQHRSEGTFRGHRRVVALDYDGAAVRSHIEPPPEVDWRHTVPQRLQNGTVDPLTASLSIAGRDCTGIVAVFDGRRRYNLHLADLGTQVITAASQQMFAGPARRCRAVVEALAGFWHSDPRHSETPTTLDFWLGAPLTGLPAVPVYLELSGSRGTLKVHLTDMRSR
jgi:hypothetical protein